ncbi:hypothetical protein IPM65_05280 [Candidatus Roizmanbacteria bacterium]|nr:MAG: hypothetical protein IPM65_05280 [Candidatus Roizmanbacteria bacterium]
MSKNNPKPIHQEKTLEQLYEFGKETAQKAAQETVDTLFFGSLFNDETQKEREKGNDSFTDLDVQKLNQAYEQNDQEEIQRLQRLINPEAADAADEKKTQTEYHKRVQREEEEYNLRQEQEEEEEKRQEALMEAEKKRMEEQEQQAPLEAPKGKKRKSILGGERQKATTELPPEFRPDAGKQ